MKVIYIKLWITFLFIFFKSLDISMYMYYNILVNKKYTILGGQRYEIRREILNNIHKIKITYEAEDEKRPATMMELQRAVSFATDEEKTRASITGYLAYEDGYLHIKF